MSHIHTRYGEHDHTVTAFIVCFDENKPYMLLHKHKKSGYFLPPGGHIELNETPWQALSRELEEEIGHSLAGMFVLQPNPAIEQVDTPGVVLHPCPLFMNTHFMGFGHYHSDTAYALVATKCLDLSPKEGESKDTFWLDREKLCNLSGELVPPNVRAVYLAIIDRFLSGWKRVEAKIFSCEK